MVSKPLVKTHVNDPIADLLARIRNANTAYKDDLLVPASRMNDGLLAILSTSRGLMTDRDAAREGVGGEVLAYVW